MTRAAGEEVVLAIDLGTSSVKLGLFAADGTPVATTRAAYGFLEPGAERRAEQDPEAWWAAVREGIRALLVGRDPRTVAAACVGGQGPTLVLVDADGRPTRPSISWLDGRVDALATRMAERIGVQHAAYSLVPRLAWVAEYEPAVLARSRWALQAWDFVGCRLAGGVGVASTIAGDRVWPEAWLEAVGLRGAAAVPPHADAGRAYGATGGRWAKEAGLPAGIPVVGGLNDGIAGMVGADGNVVGRATDPGGASGGLGLCWDAPVEAAGAHAWPGLAPGTFILGGAFAAGGKAAEWWASAAGDGDVAALLARAADAPAGSAGVVFLPFLAGERAPLWDPDVRGAFLGLGFDHGPAHLARAVVESSGYALRLLADAVVRAGARVDELRVCGGQARSPFWNRVKADVTRLPVAVPRVVDAALMGVAVCAAVGVGWYPDVLAGSAAMVQVAERFEPDPALAEVYAARFATYQAGYAALKTLPTAGK